MLWAIKLIFEPSNYIEKRNVLWKIGQFWVTWCHVTSLLRKLLFFGFLAKFGVKIDPLNYNLSKKTQNMLKRIILASKKSKNNWKTSFGSLWVLILPQHGFLSYFTEKSVRSEGKWWCQRKIMQIFKNGFACQLTLS